MSDVTISSQDIVALFHAQKVLTIPLLLKRYRCSRKTIDRKLKDVGHLTSYNQNRTGITLSDIPEFDEHGIWRCKGFIFSRCGTLKHAIQNLVENSRAGLTAGEVEKQVGVNIYHHISICVKEKMIFQSNQRTRPIYYHIDPQQRESQQKERQTLLEEREPKIPISRENIIRILLVIIKHHATEPTHILSHLEEDGIHLNMQSVQWILKRYDIEKKGSI